MNTENTELNEELVFGDIEDIYSTVEFWGKEYRLPHWSLEISDIIKSEDQLVAIWKAIDNAYPGIESPEAFMLYLWMLQASKKDQNGDDIIPTERFIKTQIDGQERTLHVSFADIKRHQESRQKFMNAEFVFRCPSVLEWRKLNPLTNHAALGYLFQYYETGDGAKYKLKDTKKLPHAFAFKVDEIAGTIILPIKGTDIVVRGLDAILELFVKGTL